jgi:hypothetical protein
LGRRCDTEEVVSMPVQRRRRQDARAWWRTEGKKGGEEEVEADDARLGKVEVDALRSRRALPASSDPLCALSPS